MHQVAYRGEGRIPRRRPYYEDNREWNPPDDVWPYSLPHRSHIREIQRPDDRTPRGYGRGPRNSRSLEAFHNMPPPHLTRGATDPYTRGPRDILVYQDEDEEPPEFWQRRPRTRETTPEHERPTRRSRRERRRHRPPPEPEPLSSESPPSDPESEEQEESDESDDEIEVVEYREEEPEYDSRPQRRHRSRHNRHSRHRYQSRDQYLSSSENPKQRRRSRRRRASTSNDEEDDDDVEEIDIQPYRHARPQIVEPPVTPTRQMIPRHPESESPKYDHQSRVTSVIESSRPPVASRRLIPGELVLQAPTADQRLRTIKIYDAQGVQHRESRSRRSASANTTREQSRSSSRRPPSLKGSNFGDSSRMSSPVRPANLRDCTACLSEVPASRCPKLECGHRKCHTCLKRSFEQSITDPQHMPPSCCDTPIRLQLVDDLFDRSFKKKWNRKFAEYSQNRIFCTSSRCGELIKPDAIHRHRASGLMIGHCDRCDERVCISCKSKWHHPRRCLKDENGSRSGEGWSSCYKCGTLTKPKEGRIHMNCRCGAQYCIVCGCKWKSCDCQWFGDDMEPAQPENKLVHTPRSRRGRRDSGYDREDPPSPGELRAGRGLPDIRPQPRSYEEEMMLQELQERRDEARRNQYISEGEYEARVGPGDLVPVRNAPAPAPGPGPGRYIQDHYGHVMGPPPVPGPPPPPPPDGRSSLGRSSLEQSPRADYVGRSKRGRSMERRLADRFSETRQAPGSMPGMEPPRSHHLGSPLMPPPMGMHPAVQEGGYSGGRVIVEHDPNDYRGDDSNSYFSHSSQSRRSKSKRRARRRERGERDEPKSSILAGLAGRGTGMGRVVVWRKYVEPGDFEGEIAAGAIVSA